MKDNMAETVAEAQAQTLVMPAFKDWREFALLMQGYKIAEELGFELSEWYHEQVARWRASGRWDLDVLHLRLALFFTQRCDRWAGVTYTEHDAQADSLLRALGQQLNWPYEGKPGA